jgi:Arc/MetJ-type ribon-helix-helix transcriptional regulator
MRDAAWRQLRKEAARMYDQVIPWGLGMTVKTTLSFTDRHHRFLTEKVGQRGYASQSAAVSAALEQMMRDDQERDLPLSHPSRRRNPRKVGDAGRGLCR